MEAPEKQRLRESLRSLLMEVMLEVLQDREGMRAAITQTVKAAVFNILAQVGAKEARELIEGASRP